ncbi:MAG: ATP synthase F1 subunit gamma [Phycisphaerae bacterium]|nr:ATP synthase F1 subunit gamma [Phycisphaerae bacterium]
MANRRLLVKRRKSVRNIRKITRTMQLIATARFQAALNRALSARPYTEKLAELIADIASAGTDLHHPLMRTHPDVKRSAMLVITSNRGLCGGYNSSVLRAAIEALDASDRQGIHSDVLMVGKKGANYFRFLRRPIARRVTGLSETPRFDQVEPIANELMDRYAKGEIASAYVSFMRFHSMGSQRPAVVKLLPLSREATVEQAEGAGPTRRVEYEFSPDPQSLLNELLPASVRVRLLQCFNEAIVSEHIARMVAMKAATDAAGEMIRNLTRQYNRARQTAITMELLDIVGGANALA